MDSTAVYDSEDGSDSEFSFSSEGEEQVIEISSHSRILISPRRIRASAWDDRSQRSEGRRLNEGKRKGRRVRQDHYVQKSPRPKASRSSAQTQKPLRSSSPRKPPLNNQPVKSNNRGDSSGSDSESDGGIVSGDSGESAGDSDAWFEDEVATPVYRPTSRTQTRTGMKKVTQRSFKHLAPKSLDDSMQSLGSPTTPGKEMEELKATLKKLARHDDSDSNSILQKEPPISSTTALQEYLTAATALGGVNALTTAEQARPTEYPDQKTRHASFHPPRSSSHMSAAPMRSKSKSLTENGSGIKLGQNSPLAMSDNCEASGSERVSFNKKLFSTPPPPFGGPGKYGAGLVLPLQRNSAANGGGQGSRAVLSALKALQDKISRLEKERETLMQQLSDTKLTARKREAELASSEKKFSYELGQTKESTRAAYDALRCDREELKLQLVKSEERRKTAQVELQRFHELTKTLSERSDDLQSQLQISESHRTRLKTEMKESEINHSRIVSELQTELTRARQDQETVGERNELLEAQFQRESSNHAESRERLKDSEQTVASISQLNEKLVAKVMEATEAANQATKKNKKLQQQLRPSTLLRPTAASRASAAAVTQAAARRAATSTAAQSGTAASPARTLTKKKTTAAGTTASSTAKKPKKAKRANNMTLLREANLGKEIPFLLGNSVQPSFSLIGNIQDALRRCDTTYVMPELLSGATIPPGPTSSHQQGDGKVHSTKQESGEANSPEVDDDSAQPMPSPVSRQQPLPVSEGTTTAESFSCTPKSTESGPRRSTKHKPPAIKVPTVSPKAYASPMQSQIMEDLGTAVGAAEKEFKGLNKRYKDLVAQMEANNRRGASEASGSDGRTAKSSTSAQLSQALGPLLDELEAKAKQLNLLKQVYQQAANSTINPPRHVVLSPEAIRRKTASLRVLNEYRQLESDSKKKGSGRSAPSPCHLGFFH
ncbi:hypothetical protein KRP22_001088 [Phytophthora ramorum]|nr:hypothetical protein KRP22_175 [Phytophthora ramorum]